MERWNEICFLLSENIRADISESDFEKNVIQALRILDWKEYSGNIQIRKSIPIGATKSIIPDLVINSSENRNLFVIEIKQPSIDLNIRFQQQLFSYMRQLKLEYGLLIGQTIQIFYDGDLINSEQPVLLETIPFEKDNLKGLEFVRLFSKESYSKESLNLFTLKSLDKIRRRNDKKRLLQKILTPEYKTKVLELIRQDFLNEYDAELIDTVLKELSINIAVKNQIEKNETIKQAKIIKDTEKRERKYDYTKYIINNDGEMLPKNRFVLKLVSIYLRNNPTDFMTLKKIFRDEYQAVKNSNTSAIGVIKRFDLVKTEDSKKRYFIKQNEILTSSDNIQFVVSTQWEKDNIGNIVNLGRRLGFTIEEIK